MLGTAPLSGSTAMLGKWGDVSCGGGPALQVILQSVMVVQCDVVYAHVVHGLFKVDGGSMPR